MKKLFTLFAFACLFAASAAAQLVKYEVKATVTADAGTTATFDQLLSVYVNGDVTLINLPEAKFGNWTMPEQTISENEIGVSKIKFIKGSEVVEASVVVGEETYITRNNDDLYAQIKATSSKGNFTVEYVGKLVASETALYNVTASVKKNSEAAQTLSQGITVVWYDSKKMCDIILPAAKLNGVSMPETIITGASWTADKTAITLPAVNITFNDGTKDIVATVDPTKSSASLNGSNITATVVATNGANTLTVEYSGAVAEPKVTVTAGRLATYSSANAFTVQGDAKAYYATVSGSTITLHEIPAGSTIAAGVGIIVLSETENEVTFTQSTEDPYAISENALKATTLATGALAVKSTAANTTTYALGQTREFFEYTGSSFIHNRAYIEVVSGAVKSMNIVFDDADAISTVKANNVNAKFIENGKVVIVKNGQKFNVAGQIVK